MRNVLQSIILVTLAAVWFSASTCWAGGCTTPEECDDGVACTLDSCNATTGDCDNVPSDALCAGGPFCEGVRTCHPIQGCIPGANPCSDGVACTIDECDNMSSSCGSGAHTPSDALCIDSTVCNGMESCNAISGCQPGTPLNCDDGIACTTDLCHPVLGCRHIPDNAACNWCNGQTCVAMQGCQVTFTPPNCNDSIACTNDSCNEASDQCVHAPMSALCDDLEFCNGAESCSPAFGCVAGSDPCDDGIACTEDDCDEMNDQCTNTPNIAGCSACNGEICSATLGCVQTMPSVDCDDGFACTQDACFDLFGAAECISKNLNGNCDDSAYCNGMEVCDPANPAHDAQGCVSGTPVNCDDNFFCTIDSCNEVTDACDYMENHAFCNDPLFCNGVETCDPLNGGAPVTGCRAGLAVNCADSSTCTFDACDESNDTCTHSTDCAATPFAAQLVWQPTVFPNQVENSIVEAGLYVTHTHSPQTILVAGVQAIITWDPTQLKLEAVVPSTVPYAWPSAGFPNCGVTCNNLNAGLPGGPNPVPSNDGDAFFVALGQLLFPPGAIGPAQVPPGASLKLATIKFKVITSGLLDTAVAIDDTFGAACTAVFWGGQRFLCNHGAPPIQSCNPSSPTACMGIQSDCNEIENGVPDCNIVTTLGGFTVDGPPPPPGPCNTNCVDGNQDGFTDNGCKWQVCAQPDRCTLVDRLFGDMGGAGGECMIDGSADANDKFHALNCFSNTNFGIPGEYPCDPQAPVIVYNVDVGGAGLSCCPDGACDANDAFAALNAFSGFSACSLCPQDSAICVGGDENGNPCGNDSGCPNGVCVIQNMAQHPCPPPQAIAPYAPRIVENAIVSATASQRTAKAGDLVRIDVSLSKPLRDLRGYQLHLGVSGGARGRLELVEIAVDDVGDHVFSELGNWDAFNVRMAQMISGLDGDGVATANRMYLASYIYRVSPDAVGTFVIDVLPNDATEPGNRTFLFASGEGTIAITDHKPAVIVVKGQVRN